MEYLGPHTPNSDRVARMADVGAGGGATSYAYEDRAELRTGTPADGASAIVEGLGLFVFYGGSIEFDDDATCFATSNGRWLLQGVAPELVLTWLYDNDCDARLSALESQHATHESRLDGLGQMLRGSNATNPVASVASVTQATFTITVAGAAIDDDVIVQHTAVQPFNVNWRARVTAADTVTVYLNNPSATTATIAAGTWRALVFHDL